MFAVRLYSPRVVYVSCYLVSLISRFSLVVLLLASLVRDWASNYVLRRCRNALFVRFLQDKYPEIWDQIKDTIPTRKDD